MHKKPKGKKKMINSTLTLLPISILEMLLLPLDAVNC